MIIMLIISFNAQANQSFSKQITVDRKGTGDFTSLQEAINTVRAFDPDGGTVILVKNGVYHEKIVIPDWICNLKILGESRENTLITYNDHAKINDMGTFRTYTMQIRGNDIQLENLTLENAAEPVAQAVALHTEGDRLIFRNCRFLGNQDTQYLAGEGNRLYFQHCYIEGTTDFIFGGATAWFEACNIHCKRDSYITAASTPQNITYGFVFDKCKITAAGDVTSVYLGRPWRPFAMTVFMNCELPEEIHPAGWENWRNPENEKTARYAEYKNRGEGSSTTGRVKWAKVLNKKEAKKITRVNVLKDFDNSL
ncbi:MAG: pectinesterase family protein [Paludibacteraceae bacterium]